MNIPGWLPIELLEGISPTQLAPCSVAIRFGSGACGPWPVAGSWFATTKSASSLSLSDGPSSTRTKACIQGPPYTVQPSYCGCPDRQLFAESGADRRTVPHPPLRAPEPRCAHPCWPATSFSADPKASNRAGVSSAALCSAADSFDLDLDQVAGAQVGKPAGEGDPLRCSCVDDVSWLQYGDL